MGIYKKVEDAIKIKKNSKKIIPKTALDFAES